MTTILSLASSTAEFTFTAALLKMQEHFTQQEADLSPMAQKNAAEKLSGALMSLDVGGNGTANQAFKSSPASDAMTLEHELNIATKDSASVDNADGNCTLEELLEEVDGLLEDFLYLKTQDRMTLSVHPVMRAALMEEEAARREEEHKDWNIRRVSFLARCEAFIISKSNITQEDSTKENKAIDLLKEYLPLKIAVL
ncbi:hypothetical protein CCHR01_11606 [Colletotrichum chrysophilum]|uniref:Uncharacterized protein n=1 Tax=Colletotrichum chrysophilum TaxID=1836956 RepID=A0AAD9AFL5_9PEZI|nr:hypothetical protein CCHR01_11606 [Colletotrichum chrysophilum]